MAPSLEDSAAFPTLGSFGGARCARAHDRAGGAGADRRTDRLLSRSMAIRDPATTGRAGGRAVAAADADADAAAGPDARGGGAVSPPRGRPNWASGNPLAHIISPSARHAPSPILSPRGLDGGPDAGDELSLAEAALARVYAMVVVLGLLPSATTELRVLGLLLHSSAATAAGEAVEGERAAVFHAHSRRAFATAVLLAPGVAALIAHVLGAQQLRAMAAAAPSATAPVIVALIACCGCPSSGTLSTTDNAMGAGAGDSMDETALPAPCMACAAIDVHEANVARSWCAAHMGPLASDIGIMPPTMSKPEVSGPAVSRRAFSMCASRLHAGGAV